MNLMNSLRKLREHIPRSQSQAELEAKNLLKVIFWVALLAPVVLIPAYYLLVAFGVLPQVHLPGG